MAEFTAEVIGCEPEKDCWRVRLSRTAFFPEGGGQYGDSGTLGEVRVLDVQERDGVIWHFTDEALAPGSVVTGRLNYAERFSKMQQHTGEHIVSGLVHRKFHYDNVGFHLGKEEVTMDFNGCLTAEELSFVEQEANRAVAENLEVIVSYPGKEELSALSYRSKLEIEGLVRIVTIPGYDTCACCAPHVKRTGEIGLIRLTGCSSYKGGSRVSMLCGFRALEDYRRKDENNHQISESLSASPDKTPEAVERLKQENFELRGKIKKLKEQLLANRCAGLPEGERDYFAFETDMDADSMRQLVNAAVKRMSGICGVFCENGEGGVRYVLGSGAVDVRPFAKRLNESLNGRGGGKPEMVQGALGVCLSQVRDYLEGRDCE